MKFDTIWSIYIPKNLFEILINVNFGPVKDCICSEKRFILNVFFEKHAKLYERAIFVSTVKS